MDILINKYGTKIRTSGGRFVLSFPKETAKKYYAAPRVEKIVILRPASISTGAIELALEHEIDIVFLGAYGTPTGRVFPSAPKGISTLRKKQAEVAMSDLGVSLAKEFITAKVLNQIAYLQELQEDKEVDFSSEILQSTTMLSSIEMVPPEPSSTKQLFGIEGFIADKYFRCLKKLHRFPGRVPGGRDKFNSAFNYGYGILYNEIERACLYVGLDPYMGFLHSDRYNKPSLVLDLIEEFRVPLVDSTLFPLFLEKTITKKTNFKLIEPGVYQLSSQGKRLIVDAVYGRLYQEVFWHNKKRKVKNVIAEQARLLARVIRGQVVKYTPFTYEVIQNAH